MALHFRIRRSFAMYRFAAALPFTSRFAFFVRFLALLWLFRFGFFALDLRRFFRIGPNPEPEGGRR